MSGEDEHQPEREKNAASGSSGALSPTSPKQLMRVPALVASALYMFLIAGVNVVSVANGLVRPAYLVFSAAFFTAALGLLLLFRWAWTLTLAAVLLLSALFFWRFSTQHDIASIMQGGLNLIILLYLIRPEVRANLRECPESKVRIILRCHPERRLQRLSRQTESKDLP